MEIRTWLDAHPKVSDWVVIDDDRITIEGILDTDRCVFPNPACGLTEMNAGNAVTILGTLALPAGGVRPIQIWIGLGNRCQQICCVLHAGEAGELSGREKAPAGRIQTGL